MRAKKLLVIFRKGYYFPRFIYYKYIEYKSINYPRTRRIQLGLLLARKLNNRVAYGVFKGMLLANQSSWGGLI